MRLSIWTILLAFTAAAFGPSAPAQEISLEEVARLAEHGNRAQALRQLEAILEVRPDQFDAVLLKGNLLVEVGQVARAEAVFSSLIKRFPDRPEAYNNLAVLQARQGRYEEAVESLVGALGTHPSYQVAYQNLGKVYGQFASQAYSKALGVQQPETSPGVDLTLLSNAAPVTALRPEATTVKDPATSSGTTLEATAPASPAPQVAAPEPTGPATAAAEESLPAESAAPGSEASKSADRGATPDPPAAEDGISSTVRGWARAWSEQRVEEYLGFYSSRFRPDDGLSRGEWAAQRRDRLSRPEYIRVTLRGLQTAVVSADRAVVTFTQSYSSDTYADVVDKRVVLVKEGGRWKILEEVSTP